MHELKYSTDVCSKCKTIDCLMNCQYMEFDLKEAREEKNRILKGEDTRALRDCVTCYACEEYCPNGNHPFYQIVERQEELGIEPVPKPITKSQVRAMGPSGKIKTKDGQGPLVNLCYFPMLTGLIRGKLFEDAAWFTGSDYMCQIMFLHFARDSVIKERLPELIMRIQENHVQGRGSDEMVCFHDECYGTYTSWAPAFGMEVPFKPVHLFDYLVKRLMELGPAVTKLNIKVAYQRPCSNRLAPETDASLDRVFDLIGVERAGREYDRGNTLCCGGVFEAQQRFDLVEDVQERNIDDMKKSGATHVVFNCPFCYFTLSGKVTEAGMAPTLVSELCQQAVKEAGNEKSA